MKDKKGSTKIYIMGLHPMRVGQGIMLAFTKQPSISDAIAALKSEMATMRVTPEQRKEITEACIAGLQAYGIPRNADIGIPSSLNWKTKGESEFSSKGWVSLLAFNLHEVKDGKDKNS